VAKLGTPRYEDNPVQNDSSLTWGLWGLTGSQSILKSGDPEERRSFWYRVEDVEDLAEDVEELLRSTLRVSGC
jgi:hypothetical protein